jgi:hypothetical protein
MLISILLGTSLEFNCYRPRDTSGIDNKTVKTRPWQISQRDGTSGTME